LPKVEIYGPVSDIKARLDFLRVPLCPLW
jgi:hypothetical protein